MAIYSDNVYINIHTQVPARPVAPTLSAGPAPSTSITISWDPAPLVSAAADAVIIRYVLHSAQNPPHLRPESSCRKTRFVTLKDVLCP